MRRLQPWGQEQLAGMRQLRAELEGAGSGSAGEGPALSAGSRPPDRIQDRGNAAKARPQGTPAGAASALGFNFSFTGTGFPDSPATVTGIVDGLVDNTNDQTTGVTVTITSAPNGLSGIVFTDADLTFGDGFDVASGQVTGVDVKYLNATFLALLLGNQDNPSPLCICIDVNLNPIFHNEDTNSLSANSLVFTPSGPGPASVPGPLPIFGAGAAFGWSRRLKRRIKTSA